MINCSAVSLFQDTLNLGQKHGQSHDEVLRQFVFIIYLGLPLLCSQHLDKQSQILKSNGEVREKTGKTKSN